MRDGNTLARETAGLPGVSLALGGGFASGFAHLGVLQVLEQQQIPVRAISGTTLGAVFGAAYASGVPVARIMATFQKVRLRKAACWRLRGVESANSGKLDFLLKVMLQADTFEELMIPVAAVATDLGSGEPVIFRQGELRDALRASCAFPGLFRPVKMGTRCLADGSLVSPVPVRAVRELSSGYVVGVFAGSQDTCSAEAGSVFHVVSRAIHAVHQNHSEGWEKEADLMLRPEAPALLWDDFAQADKAVAAGAAAARSALPRIRKFLAQAAASSPRIPEERYCVPAEVRE